MSEPQTRFDDGGPRFAPLIATMAADVWQRLERALRRRLASDATGRIAVRASANSVKGRVPP